jgi:hypothetical protein
MVLYYLLSRDLKKIEGHKFTLRAQKNSQDSVRITDENVVVPERLRDDALRADKCAPAHERQKRHSK